MKRASSFARRVPEPSWFLGSKGRLRTFSLLLVSAFVLAPPGSMALPHRALDPCGPECVRERLLSGRSEEAVDAARTLLRDEERRHGQDSREAADALDLLSSSLRQAGKGGTSEALEICRRAMAIRQSTGASDLELAGSLNELGFCLYMRGEYADARSHLERALTMRMAQLGPDHADVATSLFAVGVIRSEQGEHNEGAAMLERSLSLRDSLLGRESPAAAEVANAFASVRVRMGLYAAAESLYSRALEIWQTKWGRDHPKVATCLNNISTLLYATGDYEGAFEAKRRALGIRTRSLGPDHELVAWTLANMGMNLAAMGRVEEAREHYRRAIRIQSSRFGAESDEVGWTMKRLGDTYLEPGSYGSAVEILRRSVTYLERGLGPDHPDVAEALASLAASHAATGDTAAGNALHERAMRLLEGRLGPDHPEVGFTLTQYARALSQAGARGPALELSLRGEEISREHLRLTCRGMPERAALAYAAARPAGGRLAVSILGDSPAQAVDMVTRVWDSLVRSRTLVMDEIAARTRAAFHTQDPRAKKLSEDLAQARRHLANLQVAGPGARAPEQYRAALEQARGDMERAEKALAGVSASFSQDRKRAGVGYGDVAAALPRGAALVAYAAAQDGAQTTYVAFVLRPDAAVPLCVLLGEGRAIDHAVSRWLGDLSGGGRRDTRVREDKGRASGEAVRELVWDPVAALVEGASRVFLVPDGSLHLITFAALPWNTNEYLVESGLEFHYLSAERDLAEIASGPRQAYGLLAMGDPRFDLADASKNAGPSRSSEGCLDFASIVFPPLPSSGSEAREVASVWSARERSSLMLGREATESAFKANAPGKRLLHLATHGFFLDGDCIATEPGSRGIGATAPRKPVRRKAVAHNPIHLSGLAWAGANQRASVRRGEEDGILTSDEIAVMDLTGVEWAVLSACDTGRGRIHVGEGILGLRRAFQVAGVRTVIMSLWAVDDESAREWMTALYEARVSGRLDTTSSVTRASLSVLRERRARSRGTEPFHWAPFLAAGDWR